MSDITDPDVEAYASQYSSPEPPLLTELAAATREFSAGHGMMVGHLEGRFLKTLVGALRARRVLEIGTFTGYSALSMAEALPADGELITCEIDERHADMARRFIARSPYRDLIDVRLGPALDTVRQLDGPFDFVFIDADKPAYGDYYEAVLPLIAPSGLIAVDNVLWSGRVIDETERDRNTSALRDFNRRVVNDPRVECVIVPIRDGVMLIRRA
jgi:caffeoyl-CoA O-methyltransferase